ncbi:MAG: 16S rRNA (cytosine(1402)-N(4))-methyltransferase RsmH [Mollicutes bacterium]|nr:MAG: 16S rRNA (cytosine(1402)-N(4))-methyltransferase RsmH [Mollicutes bacterium]
MILHKPALLLEVIKGLITDKNGIYVDCTLGHGGHSIALFKKLSLSAKLIGIDQDKNSLSIAQKRLEAVKNGNAIMIKDNFVNLKKIVQNLQFSSVSGILYDLGFSAEQIYKAERGFSYQLNAPLDMRMNLESNLTAAEIINHYSGSELIKIFKNYGEEKYADLITRKIIEKRVIKSIQTTFELVNLIREALPGFALRHKHPARKIFQALRIAVNNELEVLKQSLLQGIDLLKIGGRIAIISYHSLEDRIIKKTFQSSKSIKILTKSPIVPDTVEQKKNYSSRSAKLRIVEKIHA